ncbi:HET-domain-containing protein, partial [Glonium stellatum]
MTSLIQVILARSSSWSAIGHAGEVPTKPTGEECAQKIRSWLDNCDRHHKSCQPSKSPNQVGPLPKRVLDLSDNRILLTESFGKVGHYVALSHTWGKEEFLTTTNDTLFERMRGIDFQDLPRTFRDAVNLTRLLGIRYLWIDSLCIIQGDKLDWEEQSAAMANIYSRCYLNIAATRSSSAVEGCLGARKCEVRSFRVPTNSLRTSQAVRVRLALNSSHEAVEKARWSQKNKETAPLLQRAWVYQEQTLSPRTIHLHANEMVWVCKAQQLCECRVLDGKIPGSDSWSAYKNRAVSLSELDTKQELLGLWRTIVEEHSLLDLMYESDRLPSLFGLASIFAKYFPQEDKYLAGVWESDLPRGLLWAAEDSRHAIGPMRQLSKSFGVPSWSWAA